MKFTTTQALAGLAVLVLLYSMRKRAAAAMSSAGPGQPGNASVSQAEWWTYAGSWSTP